MFCFAVVHFHICVVIPVHHKHLQQDMCDVRSFREADLDWNTFPLTRLCELFHQKISVLSFVKWVKKLIHYIFVVRMQLNGKCLVNIITPYLWHLYDIQTLQLWVYDCVWLCFYAYIKHLFIFYCISILYLLILEIATT